MRLEITRRSDLALRAMRFLETVDGPVRAVDMAAVLSSTPQYIPQVLTPLVRAGWIASEPGPRGGYRLAQPMAGRSVLELIEIIEGVTNTGICVLRDGPCTGEEHCSLHEAWTVARTALLDRLAEVPVTALVDTRGDTQ